MGAEARTAINEAGTRRAGNGSEYPPAAPAALALNGEQERMLLEHLPIVRFLARRIHERLPQHVDIEDLVSAGVVGLMDAFAKFDPAKKVQFRSYAQFRIRGAILDSLRTLDWSPRELRRKGRAVEEAIRVLTARMGRAPGEAEVALEMGLGLDLSKREWDGAGVAVARERVDPRTAGIAEAEQLGHFVEGLTGGVVYGVAYVAVVPPGVAVVG